MSEKGMEMSLSLQGWNVRQCLGCALLAWPILGVARGHEAEVSTEAVVRAWESRQGRVKSFDLAWTGVEYQRIDKTILLLTQGDNLPQSSKKPPADSTLPIKGRFVLDADGRSRMDQAGQTWSLREGKFVDTSSITIFDGKIRKSFFPTSLRGFPSAHIGKGSVAEVGRHVLTLPVCLLYRPFDGALGEFKPGGLVLTDARGVVEGRSCLVLRHGDNVVWVDPERDYIPVRFFQYRRGAVYWSVEINYRTDDQLGWVLSGWKDTRLSVKGTIDDAVTATVTKAAINTSISDDTFEVDYPDGTEVSNLLTDEWYILREGGHKRPILPGEFTGDNYQQLLQSDPPGTGRGAWFWTLLASNVALFIAIVVVGLNYRRRVRRV